MTISLTCQIVNRGGSSAYLGCWPHGWSLPQPRQPLHAPTPLSADWLQSSHPNDVLFSCWTSDPRPISKTALFQIFKNKFSKNASGARVAAMRHLTLKWLRLLRSTEIYTDNPISLTRDQPSVVTNNSTPFQLPSSCCSRYAIVRQWTTSQASAVTRRSHTYIIVTSRLYPQGHRHLQEQSGHLSLGTQQCDDSCRPGGHTADQQRNTEQQWHEKGQ